MEEELDIISRGEKFWKQSLAEMTKKYLEEFEKFKGKVKEHIQSLNLTKNQINQNFNYDSRKKKKNQAKNSKIKKRNLKYKLWKSKSKKVR
jgi:DNA topoisomerase-1